MTDFTTHPPFDLEEQRRGDVTILFARGRIEKRELGAIETAINRLLQVGRWRVVLDLSEADDLSSLTAADLVATVELFRPNGGEILVSGLSHPVDDIFRAIDPNNKMKRQSDVLSAIKQLTGRSGPS